MGRTVVDKKIAKLNIEHFQQKLAREIDPAQRKKLETLLAEEERKLEAILARERGEQSHKG